MKAAESGTDRSALMASFLRWWTCGNTVLCGQLHDSVGDLVRASESRLDGSRAASEDSGVGLQVDEVEGVHA